MLNQLANALLFLLPYEHIPSMEVFGITVRLSSLVIIIFVLGVLPRLIASKKIFPLSVIDKSIIVFYVACLLSIFVAQDIGRALIVAELLGFVLMGYILVTRAYRQSFDYKKISSFLLAAAVTTAIFGLFQFFGDVFGLSQHVTGLLDRYTKIVFGFPRIQSVGMEPLYYANFLLLPIFVLAARILSGKQSPNKWNLAMLTVILWVFVLTLSRGGFIGFFVGLAVIIVGMIREKARWSAAGYFIAVVLAALALSYASIRFASGMQGIKNFSSHAALAEGAQESSSASPRIERYKEALRLFTEHPILGIGLGNYGVVNKFGRQPDGGYDIVNNQYLESLAETGIVGFGALVSVALLLIVNLWRHGFVHHDMTALVLLATLFGIGVQYNFFSTIYILYIWVVIALAEAYLWHRTHQSHDSNP
jgi:O-antigen ligase